MIDMGNVMNMRDIMSLLCVYLCVYACGVVRFIL